MKRRKKFNEIKLKKKRTRLSNDKCGVKVEYECNANEDFAEFNMVCRISSFNTIFFVVHFSQAGKTKNWNSWWHCIVLEYFWELKEMN